MKQVLIALGILALTSTANATVSFENCPDFRWFVKGKCELPKSTGTDIELDIENKFRNDVDFKAYTSSNSVSEAASTAKSNSRSNSHSTSSATGGHSEAFSGGNNINVGGDSIEYKQPPMAAVAIAGSGNNTASCVRVLGLGGSYAGSGEAGGVSLGIPLRDTDCSLDRATRLAFANGNAKTGWRLFCNSKAVRIAYGQSRMFRKGLTHSQAVDACLLDATVPVAPVTVTETVTVEGHTHVENENGWMKYNGQTYVNLDRVGGPVETSCGIKTIEE